MKLTSFFIAILLSLTCHYRLFAQSEEDSIITLPVKMQVSANAVKKGSIKVGNNATETHCDYEELITEAKQKAKDMGGNIVKITALVPPAFVSKCYRIEADVYYDSKFRDSLLQNKTKNTAQPENVKDYALLYIYRLADTSMLAPAYNLHLNDQSVICVVKKRSGNEVKIYKEGPLTLWAKTMHRSELKMDVKFGQTYYLRCGLTGGELNTTPLIEQVDKKTGESEYAKGKKINKNEDLKYLQEMH